MSARLLEQGNQDYVGSNTLNARWIKRLSDVNLEVSHMEHLHTMTACWKAGGSRLNRINDE